jgi:GRIP domain
LLQEEIENSVNYEYLKNILISYFITNDSSVHANLLRVVFVAMKFTLEEQKRVTEAFNTNN